MIADWNSRTCDCRLEFENLYDYSQKGKEKGPFYKGFTKRNQVNNFLKLKKVKIMGPPDMDYN